MRTFLQVLGALAAIGIGGVGFLALIGAGQVWLAVAGASAVFTALALNTKEGK